MNEQEGDDTLFSIPKDIQIITFIKSDISIHVITPNQLFVVSIKRMSKSKEMYSLDESNERIKERVRQRNMELSASLESSKENLEVSSLSGGGDKSMENTQNETNVSKDVHMESPLKNRTNSDSNANEPAAESKPTPSRLKSRFSELAAEYENFEVDHNWQHACSKPKEAYMKGASPRLSIGETRASVLCTPAGMAQLKSSSTKSPGSRETSPVKQVTTIVCNQTPQKLDAVKEEPRRIHFAHPIAATHVVEYESSMCTTVNTIDESSIVAGCGMHESVDTLPIPATRMFPKNQDGEVDLSSDEYGAHTFKKKTSSEVVKDSDGQVDMSSDEYGAHTFLKKKAATPPKCSSTSSLAIMSPKPFVRSASQTHFSPVHFNPVKTSSPNCETKTIIIHKQMTTEIPLSEVNLRSTENRKDFVNELEDEAKKAASGSGGNVPPKSPSWKRVAEQDENAAAKEVSPIRSAVIEAAPAKKIAQKLEERLKTTSVKIPTPKPIISAPATATDAPITPTNIGVHTQWRGKNNTPVVVGSTPGVPIQPEVCSSNLKSLKSRWEFSSLTGTPLHPDETEDDIVKAAIRMRERAIPRKFDDKPRDPQPYLAKKIEKSVQEANKRSSLCSPKSKSPRYMDESDESEDGKAGDHKSSSVVRNAYSPYKSPAIKIAQRKSPRHSPKSPMRLERPDTAEEVNVLGDDEESMDELNVSHNVSNLIDQAFEFMDKTPNKSAGDATPMKPDRDGVAPHAEEECFSPIKQQPISLPVPPEVYKSPYEEPAVYKSPYEERAVTKSYEETDSAKRDGSSLPYTVSFYRKRIREMRSADTGVEKIDLTTDVATAPIQTIIGGTTHEDQEEDAETRQERKAAMEREVSIQQQRIAQATHALRYCKEQTEFRGSREEVDAQRALLIATETRRALLFEIDRLNRGLPKGAPGPRGTLTITSINVLLSQEFVNSQFNYTSNREDIYYFIVLLRHGCEVQHTSLVTSDEGLRKKGVLEFNYYLSLKDLPPNFVCALEVFGLRTKREHISHEVKYRLTGTLSKKILEMLKGSQRSKIPSTLKTSLGGPSALAEPAFQLVGRLTIDINTTGRKLALQDVMTPLEGHVIVKMKKHATEKSNTINRGFLSMYQRTKDGLGTWTRYWCVLEGGEMRFWRSPDEERDGKQWVVLLDLQTCAGDGASTVRDVCPYPNSFHIDVWVPKEGSRRNSSSGRPELEKLRVMLAADTSAHLESWLEVINQTARHVLMWDRPSGMPK
nr:Pleckstrin homology domain containing protein [Haemonchus contortus]